MNTRVIQVEDKLPLLQLFPLSLQHLFAMFGATVLVPILFKINPAYSSFIGNIMYNYDDSINASLEIGRRGFEIFVLKNKKFYPELNLSSLKDQWKEYFNDGIKSWKEFYLVIKNLELKYRVSLEHKVLSHISKKSNVNYYFQLC